jgi:hypothetical protein
MSWLRRSSNSNAPDLRIGEIYDIEEIRTAEGEVIDFATFIRNCGSLMWHQRNCIIRFWYREQLLTFYGIGSTLFFSQEVHCQLQDSVQGKSFNRLECMVFADPQQGGVKLRVESFLGDTLNTEKLSDQHPSVGTWNVGGNHEDYLFPAIVHLEKPSFYPINSWTVFYQALQQAAQPRKCRVEILHSGQKYLLGAGEAKIHPNSITGLNTIYGELVANGQRYSVSFIDSGDVLSVVVHRIDPL